MIKTFRAKWLNLGTFCILSFVIHERNNIKTYNIKNVSLDLWKFVVVLQSVKKRNFEDKKQKLASAQISVEQKETLSRFGDDPAIL